MTEEWDPRPQWVDGRIETWRCTEAHVTAERVRRCPTCGASVTSELHEPTGEIWSWTVARMDAEPFGLAYVDLTGGPRVLARFAPDAIVRTGRSVRLRESLTGDVEMEAAA